MGFEFVRYDDTYKDIIDILDKETFAERDITNLGYIDRKNSRIVKLEGNVIGISSITFSQGIPTVQCILLKQYRGKGYGTNILTELTNQLFIEGYERVELLISPRNKSSIASAEKARYHLDYSNVEFNLDNEDSMYLTYYKNNYRKIR